MGLCFVIPVYNEGRSVAPLARAIAAHAPQPCRILFVDDGSTDETQEELRKLQAELAGIDVIRLRQNRGKTAALALGLSQTDADVVVTMDGDLQDDPAEIPRLLALLDQGYDMVCGWKTQRQDPWHKTFPSRIFNWGVAHLFGLPLHDVNTGFKAMRGETARALPLSGGMHRFMPVLAAQLGYRVTELPVAHHARRFGHSKYGWTRMLHGARDAAQLWLRLRSGALPPREVPAADDWERLPGH
jgi:glycosyltransferase involved in cell wall biosynthesis